jgi:Ca2+-binding RTX toxin-like protein
MATLQFFQSVDTAFPAAGVALISVSDATAIYSLPGGATAEVSGTGLTSVGGALATGTITQIRVFNGAGDAYLFTGLSSDAATFHNLWLVQRQPADVVAFLLAGADGVTGSPNDDVLFSGPGSDAINGGDGFDVLSYNWTTPEPVGIAVTITAVGQGVVVAGGDSDTFVGIEAIEGTSKADTFIGAGGRTLWTGGNGADFFDGGLVPDQIDYQPEQGGNGVVVNLAAGTAIDTYGNVDTFVNIDRVRGSLGSDHITGSAIGNRLRGSAGDDTVFGGAGFDELEGNQGNDTLDGGASLNDQAVYNLPPNLQGTVSHTGFDANGHTVVRITDGAGGVTDLFDIQRTPGGWVVTARPVVAAAFGTDLVSFETEQLEFNTQTASGQIVTTLGLQTGGLLFQNSSTAWTLEGSIWSDNLDSRTFEGINARVKLTSRLSEGDDIFKGHSGVDAVSGGGGRDRLHTGAGADKVNGGAGNDVIWGSAHKDVLTGGKGKFSRDAFAFDYKVTKNNYKKHLDKITDFEVKYDSIYIDDKAFGNKAFKKIGKKASVDSPKKISKAFFTIGDKAKDKNDYLIYDKAKGVLWYDADGTGAAAAVQLTTLSKNLKLKYTDFFII